MPHTDMFQLKLKYNECTWMDRYDLIAVRDDGVVFGLTVGIFGWWTTSDDL